MKEVKQAWTSLMSSRNSSLTSGNSSCVPATNGTPNNSIGKSDVSRATWYDGPTPEIVHSRKFVEAENMDVRAVRKVPFAAKDKIGEKDSTGDSEKSVETLISSKRTISKDSGIETIASLRRTFLDEFRKSNSARSEDNEDDDRENVGKNGAIKGQEISTKMQKGERVRKDSGKFSGPQDVVDSALSPGDDQVLYQNNVEVALNSLSMVCGSELDSNEESPKSKNSELFEQPKESRECISDDGMGEGAGNEVRKRNLRRRNSSTSSRRHSSSVEIMAMTTVKTDEEGMPTLRFSFLHGEANPKPFITDINIDDDEVVMSMELSEPVEPEQLYDFPKGQAKIVVPDDRNEGIVDAKNADENCGERKKSSVLIDLTKKRMLGDGDDETAADQLYDFPKRRIFPPECLQNLEIDNSANGTIFTESSRSPYSIHGETSIENKDIFEGSIQRNELASPVQNCIEIETSELSRDPETFNKSRTYSSLRSDRSVRRLEISGPHMMKGIEAYYSDPECQESSRSLNGLGGGDEKSASGKHRRRRFGKAWGKMRTWLREEKSRFGEVVNRHARMQAVGSRRSEKSENGCESMGSRSGSYDLVEARTRELGLITRVEEFGLSSVSEEGNVSDPERLERTSYDLEGPREGATPEIPDNEENTDADNEADDNAESVQKKKKANDNETPDNGNFASARLRRTLSADKVIGERGTGMKLTLVSFSHDKLSNDDGVDDDSAKNGIVPRRRDPELTTRDHVGKGGLIKRRMLGSIRGLMASTHLLQQHEPDEGGPGGFEDVRRYVKQGGDFCKELAAVLHERAELEASYSKGLSKLSSKLTKACAKDQGGNSSGGVTEAWRSIGEEMEAAAEAHRAWGMALTEQLAKPLRVGVAEAQGRSRKLIESSVDKASKSLQEWRGIAAKSKKQSFACARENERLQDLARIQSISHTQQQANNNKTTSHHHQMTEKEANKLETRRRKAEDSSRRADTEFYTVSVRAERARLEYESTVRKGAKQMELLEEERLSALKDLANVYLAHLQALAPRLQQSADRLSSPVRNCNVSQDVDILRNVIRRLDSGDGTNVDQLLPDFYAEHVTLAMNRERRKQSLVRVLHLIRQDLERERRGREGLETLHRAFIQTPAFAADESTQNVTEKLHHMRSMLTFLEAARYKVGGTLAEVEGGKRDKHPLAEHILVSRDKQGLQQSVLKVPSWAKSETFEFPETQDELDIHITKVHEAERRDWVDRTAGDGNSENPPDEEDFSDFDEFSSQSEDNNNQEVEITDIADKADIMSEQCRAIYQYSANLNDELSLTPGDVITIHEKQADGWWIGECAGRTGIFPATYVEIIH